ncbi:MAG TPA: protein kinase family protein [Nocardioidaceae bacterium]|nr:protein kinase family protein [Nocardioidaceae bacterium]
MEGHAIQPGSILAGRYRVDDLVGEAAGSTTWRAFDEILNRSVSIRAVAADDPRCPAFLDAARSSTAVSDPRFLPVLDAVPDEDGIAYVVREWSRGLPLSVILREGPLPSRRAATIVGEVAEALSVAHDVGMPHRAINPSTVLVKESGAVRITGLGTEHALRAAAPAPKPNAANDPNIDTVARHAGEQVDARALGRIFYACLVARWPGGRGFGLPPAPTEHGRLLRPRQVRAGVSRGADRVSDRILGQPPHHHAKPLTTARAIADQLATVEDDDSMLADTEITGEISMLPAAAGNGFPGPPPALLPSRPRPAPPPRQVSRLERSRDFARQATEGHRKLIWLGIALLVALATLVGIVVGRQSADETTAATGNGGRGAAGTTEAVALEAHANDFDPLPNGNEEENAEEAHLAVDGDPETGWTTKSYYTYPELGHLKDGVGLMIDLGDDHTVTDVTVDFGASPTSYEIWATPEGTTAAPNVAPPASPEGSSDLWESAFAKTNSEQRSKVSLDPSITTRYVLVWLTKLPPDDDGTYTGVVNEVTIEGPPS